MTEVQSHVMSKLIITLFKIVQNWRFFFNWLLKLIYRIQWSTVYFKTHFNDGFNSHISISISILDSGDPARLGRLAKTGEDQQHTWLWAEIAHASCWVGRFSRKILIGVSHENMATLSLHTYKTSNILDYELKLRTHHAGLVDLAGKFW